MDCPKSVTQFTPSPQGRGEHGGEGRALDDYAPRGFSPGRQRSAIFRDWLRRSVLATRLPNRIANHVFFSSQTARFQNRNTLIPMSFKPGIPFRIQHQAVRQAVLKSIQLNIEHRLNAEEIQKRAADKDAGA